MMPRRAVLAAPAVLLPGRAAALVRIDSGLAQGGFVNGRTEPGTRLALDGRAVRVGRDGAFAFGFGRDHGTTAALSVTAPGGRSEIQTLGISRRQWNVQAITGLPPGQVTPDAEALERIRRERERLGQARATDSARGDFSAGFVWPARGRISGIYGSQRVLNGQPRQPHLGLDVAAPVGTPILATASGKVSLADEFFFFGKLIVLDHGHGVNSLYAHLSAMDVAEGAEVTAGQRIGALGATGRVTGPHLHFSLSWYQVFVDPQPVLPPA